MIPGGRPRHKAIRESKKDDPPGGQPGGSCTTRGWMRRPCRTQDPGFRQSIISNCRCGRGEGRERCNSGLIDMKTPSVESGPLWSRVPVGRSVCDFRFESGDRNFEAKIFYIITDGYLAIRQPVGARKRRRIKFIDIGEQFAERAGAVIEQALAFFRRGQCRIPGGAAGMKSWACQANGAGRCAESQR